MKPPHLHVTTERCELRHCGWRGFHIHWLHRRHRSAFDGSMTPAELDAFDAACASGYPTQAPVTPTRPSKPAHRLSQPRRHPHNEGAHHDRA